MKKKIIQMLLTLVVLFGLQDAVFAQKTLPYITSFATDEENNEWTVIDHNEDGNTWHILSRWESANCLINYVNTADDYMVTPQLIASADSMRVVLNIEASGLVYEAFSLWVMNSPDESGIESATNILETQYIPKGALEYSYVLSTKGFKGEPIYIAIKCESSPDRDISLNFTINDFKVEDVYSLSVNANDRGVASVSSSGETSNSYILAGGNTSATYTATPNDGYGFANWSDEDGVIVSTDAEYNVPSVTDNINLTANFVISLSQPYTTWFATEEDDWSILNSANDNYTWKYDSTGYMYCNHPPMSTSSDFLISPQLISLSDSIKVVVTMVSTSTTESYSLWVLNSPDNVENATKVVDTQILSANSYTKKIYVFSTEGFKSEPIYIAIKCETYQPTITGGKLKVYDFTAVDMYTLKVNAKLGGTATVSSTECGTSSTSILVEPTTSATYTATRNNGYTFVGWRDEDGTLVSTDAEYSVANIRESLSLTANFGVDLPYTTSFDTEEESDTWTIIDNNADGKAWVWFDTVGEYSMRYDGAGGDNSADDYIISPAIFAYNNDIQLSISARTSANGDAEKYSIWAMTSPDAAGIANATKVVDTQTIDAEVYTEYKHYFTIDDYVGDKVYFAIKCESDANDGYLLVNEFAIGERTDFILDIDALEGGLISFNSGEATTHIYEWVEPNTSIELTAIPDRDYYFIAWLESVDSSSGQLSRLVSSDINYKFNVTEDLSFNATFIKYLCYTSFDSDEDNAEWSVIDYNNDGETWELSTTFSEAVIETSYNGDLSNEQTHNDYLISPAISVQSENIEVYLSGEEDSNVSLQKLSVWLMASPDEEGIESAIEILPTQIISTDKQSLGAMNSSFAFSPAAIFGGEYMSAPPMYIGIKCESDRFDGSISLDEVIVKAYGGFIVQCAADGGGLVGIDDSDLGSRVYKEKNDPSNVKFTAQPAEGYTFINWTDDDGVVVSTEAVIEEYAPSFYTSLTAHFRATLPYSLDNTNSLDIGSWSFINANNDACFWTIYSPDTEDYLVFGGNTRDSNVSHDDYLVSPRILVENNNIELNMTNSYYDTSLPSIIDPELFSVYIMTSPDEEGIATATKVNDAKIKSESKYSNYIETDDYIGEYIYIAIKRNYQEDQESFSEVRFKNISIIEHNIVVEASADGGGNVAIDDTDSDIYVFKGLDSGVSTTFKALPNDGYTFVCWRDADGNKVSIDATYSVNSVTNNMHLTADFAAILPFNTSITTNRSPAQWSVVDYNNDGKTWGTDTSGANFSCSVSSTAVSDDYLISPRLEVTEDNLDVTISIRNEESDTYNIYSLWVMTSPDSCGIANATKVVDMQHCKSDDFEDYSYAFSVKEFKGEDIYLALKCESNNTLKLYINRFDIGQINNVVRAKVNGGGTVSINDVLSGVDIYTGVEDNVSVTFTESTYSGYTFINWSSEDGTTLGAESTYTINNVTDNVSVFANYKAIIPYSTTFNVEQDVSAWRAVDYNGDGNTWDLNYSSVKGDSFKYDGALTTEAANDYLVSPRISIEKSTLIVTIDAEVAAGTTGVEQKFSIWVATTPDYIGMTNAKSVYPTQIVDDDSSPAYQYYISVDDYIGDDIYIAIKCESLYNTKALYINDFAIDHSDKPLVIASAIGGGYISINGSSSNLYSAMTVDEGGSATFTANPNSDYTFVNWTDGDDREVGTESTYVASDIYSNIELVANFRMNIPHFVTFYNKYEADSWSVVDNNADGFKWNYNSKNFAMEFIPAHSYSEADDYLVSPKFIVEDDYVSIKMTPYDSSSSTSYYSIWVIPSGGAKNLANAVKVGDSHLISNDETKITIPVKDYIGEDISIAIRCDDVPIDVEKVSIYNIDIKRVANKIIDEYTYEDDSNTYNKVIITPNNGENTGWTIGNKEVEAFDLNIVVDENGKSSDIGGFWSNGSLTADTTTVIHSIRGGEWKVISVPFDFNLADIIVDGEAPVYGTNVVLQTYSGAKRATSYEGWTVSGWEYKTSGIITANQGFAIGIDAEIGEVKNVKFKNAQESVYRDIEMDLQLELNPCSVNNGMDGDWNLIGNPLLSSGDGEGFALYLYNSADNSYKEYGADEYPTLPPHTAMFVQGDTDFEYISFNGSSFSKPYIYESMGADAINSRVVLTINGDDDEAKMLIVDGTSPKYVRNEDAIYFPPLGDNVSQIYYIDGDNLALAVTELPDATTTKVAYNAIEAGVQSIAMTTNIDDKALYLEDAVTGETILMTDGIIYEFESAAGTVKNRFTLVVEGDVTAVKTTERSDVKVVVGDNMVTVIDAEIGANVAIFSTNGVELYNGVITSSKEVIAISTQGLLIVKVGDEVIKAL